MMSLTTGIDYPLLCGAAFAVLAQAAMTQGACEPGMFEGEEWMVG